MTKRDKTFYGCDNSPTCKSVAWARPILEKCPECDSPYLVEKHLKSGSWAACPNKECKYKHEIAKPEQPVAQAG